MRNYNKALSRDDLSQWLIHLCKSKDVIWPTPSNMSSFDILKKILTTNKILASKLATKDFDSNGAACFYEVPPQNYKELINTNPNNRKGHGIIVSKTAFWFKGGRPAIYIDDIPNKDIFAWPTCERYRLIRTDLCRSPQPVDWMHEREWRLKGDFTLSGIENYCWWWPCVETILEAQILFKEFNEKLHSIYIIELNRVLNKNEILF